MRKFAVLLTLIASLFLGCSETKTASPTAPTQKYFDLIVENYSDFDITKLVVYGAGASVAEMTYNQLGTSLLYPFSEYTLRNVPSGSYTVRIFASTTSGQKIIDWSRTDFTQNNSYTWTILNSTLGVQ